MIHLSALLLIVLWRLRLELVLRLPLGRLLPIHMLLRARVRRILVVAIGRRLVMARAIHRLRVLAEVVPRVRGSVMVVMVVEFIVKRVMFVHGGNIGPDCRQ